MSADSLEQLRTRSSPIVPVLLAGLGLLLAAIVAAAAADRGLIDWQAYAPLLVLLALLSPDVCRRVESLGERFADPSPRVIRITTFLLFAGTVGLLQLLAALGMRLPGFVIHDENSMWLQTLMLAQGKLWLPQHPLHEMLETMLVLTTPVYASMYFPGAALLFAPLALLNLPPSLGPIVCAGGIVAVLYRLLLLLFRDNRIAFAVAILPLANSRFRLSTMLYTAHLPTLLMGLGAALCYFAWRQKPRVWVGGVMGGLAGWMFITRPGDAVVVLVPIGLGLLLDAIASLRSRSTLLPRTLLLSLAAAALATLPFLALQAYANHGITGSIWHYPFSEYHARYQPGMKFFPDLASIDFQPQTRIVEKLEFYRQERAELRSVTPGNALVTWFTGGGFLGRQGTMLSSLLAIPLVGVLIPLGLLALRERRWVLALQLPLHVLLYIGYPFYLPVYTVQGITAVAALEGGALARIRTWIGSRWITHLSLLLALLTLSHLPRINLFKPADNQFYSRDLDAFDREMQKILALNEPAVVFVGTSDPRKINVHIEPVYNVETANPDENVIVKLHFLSPADALNAVDYYERVQPGQRTYYIYDRNALSLIYRGDAALTRAKLRGAIQP